MRQRGTHLSRACVQEFDTGMRSLSRNRDRFSSPVRLAVDSFLIADRFFFTSACAALIKFPAVRSNFIVTDYEKIVFIRQE